METNSRVPDRPSDYFLLPFVFVQGQVAIKGLVQQAAGRISIMAAGGVTAANAAELVARSGVREIHSSAKQ